MDPRRPFNPNTPVHPTNQPPFGFPSTPGTPSSQPFPGFNTQPGFNPWQMQVQHHQWHMPQHQWQPQPQTQTQPEHDFVSLASHDDHVPETQVPPPMMITDARCTININDDPEFEDEAPTPRSVRPPGRDTAKKAASGGKGKRVETGSGSGSKEVKDKAVEKIELLLQNFNEFKQEQTERYLERKKEKEEARARDIERLNMEKKEKEETAAREAMRLELERKRLEMEMSRQEATELALMQAPLDNLTEEERKVAAKVKDNIIKRWLGGSMNM